MAELDVSGTLAAETRHEKQAIIAAKKLRWFVEKILAATEMMYEIKTDAPPRFHFGKTIAPRFVISTRHLHNGTASSIIEVS